MATKNDITGDSLVSKVATETYRDNWDLIFKPKKDTAMIDEHDNEHDHEDGEWTCDVCGGPMYSAAHWNYGQCDDCGAKQELINDDYI